VLDEPLANLDINTQQKFLSDLKVLLSKRDEPLAIILSSQQLHEIESVATQMLFLKKGSAVFSGTINEISDEEEFNLFEMQLSDEDTAKLEEVYKQTDQLKKSGPYLQLSTVKGTSEVLQELLGLGIEVKYFRDLSKSTKRFFN
jgi:ABC-2 type transport system ATP-binding protein